MLVIFNQEIKCARRIRIVVTKGCGYHA